MQKGLCLCKLPVQSRRGQGPANSRTLAEPAIKSPETTLQTSLTSKAANVPNRTINSYRKTSSPRLAPHETDTVALEKQLESTGITRKGDCYTTVTPSSPKVVASGRECSSGSTTTPSQSCSANFY